jgi:DNA invertase Pin-like site-specific DNA recombinase
MARGKFIAYYRVSTERQGKSGLGLDAQRAAVLDYLNGGGWKLLGEFTEVETGKGRNALARRPQLRAALEACRKQKATLLIAKLDRLARNVHFVSGLMESGVEFVAVDMPMANRLTVHILAAVAEHEREMISQRTKAALAAAKVRGVELGRYGKTVLASRNRSAAVKRARDLLPILAELDASGITSTRAIAQALNDRNVLTPAGKHWHQTSVVRALRLAGLP